MQEGRVGTDYVAKQIPRALVYDQMMDILLPPPLQERPLNATDEAAVAERIPPPMIPDNWPTLSDRCFVGDFLQKVGLAPVCANRLLLVPC